MAALPAARTQLQLSQVEMPARLNVSVDSLRVWDCGRRPPPVEILEPAQALVRNPDEQLLPLRTLGERFRVHVRTLRAARSRWALAGHVHEPRVLRTAGSEGDGKSRRDVPRGRVRESAGRLPTHQHSFPYRPTVQRGLSRSGGVST